MELISVPGGKIATYVEGSGPAVIFIHGGPGDTHDYMKRMASPLYKDFTCIFFDQRGTGESHLDKRNPEQFKLELLFEDLLAIKKHYKLSSAILVGHSWGAMYALFACLRHPDVFKKAALLNMGPLDSEVEKQCGDNLIAVFTDEEKDQWKRLRKERNKARDAGDLDDVLRADEELMEMRVKSWIFNPPLREHFLIEYFKDPPPDREVNMWIWENASGWFNWDMLKTCQADLWILAGSNDAIPVAQAEKVKSLAPNAKLTEFKDCGHIPWLEHPQSFYENLTVFLKS